MKASKDAVSVDLVISVAVSRAAGHMDTIIAYHDITYMSICAAGHSNITTSDCIVHQNVS